MNKALVIVDVQADFLPGGSLGVDGGHQIVPSIVKLAQSGNYAEIIASRDWHPYDHCSFSDRGGEWPPHCIQGTPGAEIDDEILDLAPVIISKAMSRDEDAYSAFEGTPDLTVLLKNLGTDQVDIVGLATDVCVRATALSAMEHGLITSVILEGTRPVTTTTGMRAVANMVAAGVKVA